MATLRSRAYLRLLVLAAIIGVPVSAVAYWYLYLVSYLQQEIFTHLPHGLGFSSEPVWWPLPVLAVGAVLVALAITYLPGRGGPSPAYGFKLHGPPTAAQLPGVILATLATLIFGMVLGPEMPLILLGGGLAALSVRLARRDVPDQAKAVVASAGSFAAISTLLGSPIVGAFLLMEASGLGGQMLSLVLLPGLLAAGVGSLIFIGLDAWTGHGVFSLAIQGAPHFGRPDIAEFGWALVIGVAAALVGSGIRRCAPVVHRYAERWTLALTAAGGTGRRRAGDRLRRGHRQAHVGRAVLGPGQRSRRWSRTPPATPWARCCCSWCARGWRTSCRWAASGAGRSSRRCSSARRAASPCPTCPGCR